MADSPLTGEVSNSKVAAVFADVASATHVAERVRQPCNWVMRKSRSSRPSITARD